MTALSPRAVTAGYALAVLLPLAAVAAALYTQYQLGMLPCPWCVLQRLVFVCIAIAALPGLVLRLRLVRRSSAGLMLLLAACGMASALWQHFVAAPSGACAQSLADHIVQGSGLAEALPEVFAAYASCADAAVKLFGLSYEFWSLGVFAALAALSATLLRRA